MGFSQEKWESRRQREQDFTINYILLEWNINFG